MTRVRAFVGLGANLGDARAAVQQAMRSLGELPHTTLAARSSLWRSAPVDSSGPDYINAAAALDTELAPRALLAELQRIEHAHGRERPYRNAPRTLDLDLLLYGDERIDDAQLTVPHPRMLQRAFVLRPLHEIDRGLVLPDGLSIENALARLDAQDCECLADSR